MLRLRLSIIAALAFVTACGGVAVTDLDNQLLDSYCQWYVRCGLVKDTATCKKVLGNNAFNTAQLEHDVSAGKVSYDEGLAGDCLDAIAGQSCNPGDKDRRVSPTACDNAIKGKGAPGATCFVGGECQSGSCSKTCTEACCAGTCDPLDPPKVAIGGDCGTAGAVCVDEAYCDGTTIKCTALKASGSTCQFGDECAFGLVCIGEPSTCQNAVAVGGNCVAGECGTTGLRCNSTTMKCEKLLFDGATCDPQNSGCANYLFCDPSTSKCSAGLALGAACDTQSIPCALPNFCKAAAGGTTGTCTGPQANGATCNAGDECSSGFCDSTSGLCADRQVCI